MLLATRCPHCETVFRLRQDHLTLHGGLVRCGHCQQVFDAASSLVEAEPLLEAAARATDGPAASSAAETVAHSSAAATADDPAAPAALNSAPARPAADIEPAAAVPPHTGDPAASAPLDDPATATLSDTPDANAALSTETSPHASTLAPAADLPRDDHNAAPLEPAPPLSAHDAAQPASPATLLPPRPFATSEAHASSDAHQDFAPGAWDMWAPWLDGGVDPELRHSGANVSTAPLVPLSLPAQSGPGPDGTTAIARFSGEPVPFADAEPEPAPELPPPPAAPVQEPPPPALAPAALEPTLAATSVAPAAPDGDHREPHFTAAADTFAASPTDDQREHFAMTRETRAPERRGGFVRLLGGFVLGLVLVLSLLAQLAWWQREKVMVNWPASQMLFARACATLGCRVEPPRAIDGLRLDASDLRQLDGPRLLELKVPLTNHSPVALAYPSIELTLFDQANHVAVRRVLAPREYVRPGQSLDSGIPSGATQTMFVRIETGGVTASNFLVQIFYP
jgi:predicted Zn finger-like uncharacterized protein